MKPELSLKRLFQNARFEGDGLLLGVQPIIRALFALLTVTQFAACARTDMNPWRVSSLEADVQCTAAFVPVGDHRVSVVYRIMIVNSGSRTIASTRVFVKPWILPSFLLHSALTPEIMYKSWSWIDIYKTMPAHAREVFTKRSVPTPHRATMRNGPVPCVLSSASFSDGKFWSLPGAFVLGEHAPPPHPL